MKFTDKFIEVKKKLFIGRIIQFNLIEFNKFVHTSHDIWGQMVIINTD